MTGFGGFIGMFGALGMITWLNLDRKKSEWRRRIMILSAFGFLKGTSLGDLVRYAMYIDPSIIITALLGTIAIFGSFSLAALISKRRSYLFLSGFLTSALSLLSILGLANIFFWSIQVYIFQLYMGLLLFSGFVIVDTQIIIEVLNICINYSYSFLYLICI